MDVDYLHPGQILAPQGRRACISSRHYAWAGKGKTWEAFEFCHFRDQERPLDCRYRIIYGQE